MSQADERALCVLPSSYSSAARTIKVEDARYCNRMSWCDVHHWYHDVLFKQLTTIIQLRTSQLIPCMYCALSPARVFDLITHEEQSSKERSLPIRNYGFRHMKRRAPVVEQVMSDQSIIGTSFLVISHHLHTLHPR